MKPKGTIVSTKLHIGNQKFVSVEAHYDRDSIVKLTYNVFKQYGYSMFPIGNAILENNGMTTNMGAKFGIECEAIKEKVFKHFTDNLSTEMRRQIKTIIKGV